MRVIMEWVHETHVERPTGGVFGHLVNTLAGTKTPSFRRNTKRKRKW